MKPDKATLAAAVEIQKLVADHFSVPLKLMLSRRRSEWIVWPRHLAMYLIQQRLGLSLTAIGRLFGRTHTAVLHAHSAVEARLATSEKFRQDLAAVVAELDRRPAKSK